MEENMTPNQQFILSMTGNILSFLAFLVFLSLFGFNFQIEVPFLMLKIGNIEVCDEVNNQ